MVVPPQDVLARPFCGELGRGNNTHQETQGLTDARLRQRLLTNGFGLAYCSNTFIRTGSLLPTPGR